MAQVSHFHFSSLSSSVFHSRPPRPPLSKWAKFSFFKQAVAMGLTEFFYDDLTNTVVSFLPDDCFSIGYQNKICFSKEKLNQKSDLADASHPFKYLHGQCYSHRLDKLFLSNHFKNRIYLWDCEQGFQKEIGKGVLSSPFQINLNPNEDLLAVANHGKSEIVLLSTSLEFINSFQLDNEGSPTGVDWINDRELVVCDSSGKRVLVTNTDGELVCELDCKSEWKQPFSVAVDRLRGFIYVNDWGKNRIEKFDLKSKSHLASIDCKMTFGRAISIDQISGKLMIADCGDNTIKILNREAVLIDTIKCEEPPFSVCFLSR